MNENSRMIPESYVKDILAIINDYLPWLEQGMDKIEKEIELQKSPEMNEEVKSFMKIMGYPDLVRLEELKERRERLQKVHQLLSK